MLILVRSHTGNPRVLGRHVLNPADLIAWAVSAHRISAADVDLWAARLAGPGADAYSDQLLA